MTNLKSKLNLYVDEESPLSIPTIKKEENDPESFNNQFNEID